jgi:hypothetical protein
VGVRVNGNRATSAATAASGRSGVSTMSDFAATGLPLQLEIPKQLGLGFNKTDQQLLLSI